MPTRSNSHRRPQLAVVFVQYDKVKYSLALERLIALTDSLKSVDSTLVVVDNQNTGGWYHQISNHLIHLGGDNTHWEFSAFDRGVRFLQQIDHPYDLIAFVTDAFMAYGDEFLQLINDELVHYTSALSACIGWVDTLFEELQILDYRYTHYLRTSFLLMPRIVHEKIRFLNSPVPREEIFSNDPTKPFHENAPLSQNLQEFLVAWLTTSPTEKSLEERWHSQFKLSAESLEFFQAKSLAILREHLLSARFQGEAIACYDLRLIHRLVEKGLTPEVLSAENLAAWQWLAWKEEPILKEPQFFVDHLQNPQKLTHGDEAFLEVAGWVCCEPQTPLVGIRLSNLPPFFATCDHPRNDQLPGFFLRVCLQHIPPGTYDIEWFIPDTSTHQTLGKLEVAARVQFQVKRSFFPEVFFEQNLPISLEGELTTSAPVEYIETWWDGKLCEDPITSFTALRKDRADLNYYQVLLNGSLPIQTPQQQHTFELIFFTENGSRKSWRHFVSPLKEGAIPFSLSIRKIDKFCPDSNLTSIRLRGTVGEVYPGDQLILKREGITVLREPLQPENENTNLASIAWFDCQRELAAIPPGTWNFSIALEKAKNRLLRELTAWQHTVQVKTPRIHVENLEVIPLTGPASSYLLKVSGWIENDFLTDYLIVELDDKQAGTFGLEQLRPAHKARQIYSHIQRQDFHLELPLESSAGEHAVRLITGQRDGHRGTWSRHLFFEEHPEKAFLLESQDLEKLNNRRSPLFWSSLTFKGTVSTPLQDVRITLYVNDQEVDQKILQSKGDFLVRFIPQENGPVLVRVVIENRKHVLYDSGTSEVHLAALEIPAWTTKIINRLIDRFSIQSRSLQKIPREEIIRHLLEEDLENVHSVFAMLRQCEKTLKISSRSALSEVISVDPNLGFEVQSLSILFACWEVPCLRHGGGVCMTNLLKDLSQRHRITVVHPYSVEETGWVDDIRPFVDRIISVPRSYRQLQYRHDAGVPEHYYSNYTPELHKAIEAEILTGEYDLVNYEYSTMFAHLSALEIPQVLVVHESALQAKLTTYFKKNQKQEETVEQVSDLLRTLYFNTSVLPQAVPNLITLTEEDGQSLCELQPRAKIYVNTIGVDEDRFAAPSLAEPQRETEQTLVFLGNYRHPPNVHASLFLAEEILPMVLRWHPQVQVLLIGSHAPSELQALDEQPNITVTGFVEDFRPYLWNATASVAPIFIGAGMRVKILETMACACPIICTQLGMNGLGAVANEHYLRAETAPEFAAAIRSLIEEPERAKNLGQKGRELIEQKHSVRIKAREREVIWSEVLNASGDHKASSAKSSKAWLKRKN